MANAKCTRCGGTASGKTFPEAANKIDHAVGLSRGIPCGASYGAVIDTTPKPVPPPPQVKPSPQTLAPKTSVPDFDEPNPKTKTTQKSKTK